MSLNRTLKFSVSEEFDFLIDPSVFWFPFTVIKFQIIAKMRRIFLKKIVSLNPSIAGKNINIEFNLVQEGTSCHVIED